ncbi:MAG TPA: STAS domain-containing protein [Acidimicrobiia bacterium]|jgi:anti-anti-sigma factor|nr:STAS domain-containing protein [Acidimicrobiia bacterium]
MAQIQDLDQKVGSAQLLRWSIAAAAGTVTVALEGELDLANSESVREVLREVTSRKPAQVVVNLAQLSFLDSSGIRCLIGAVQDADSSETRLEVRQPQAAVRRVMEVCGVDELLLGAPGPDTPPNR